MSYHRTPAGLIKMPRKSPVAAYLKGRPLVTARPHRNPKRATLHPGKAEKKRAKRLRHRLHNVGRSLDESAAGFDRLREAVDRSGETVKALGESSR